jgi:hypothetical protein
MDWILKKTMEIGIGINISLYFNVTNLDYMEVVLLLSSSSLKMQESK